MAFELQGCIVYIVRCFGGYDSDEEQGVYDGGEGPGADEDEDDEVVAEDAFDGAADIHKDFEFMMGRLGNHHAVHEEMGPDGKDERGQSRRRGPPGRSDGPPAAVPGRPVERPTGDGGCPGSSSSGGGLLGQGGGGTGDGGCPSSSSSGGGVLGQGGGGDVEELDRRLSQLPPPPPPDPLEGLRILL